MSIVRAHPPVDLAPHCAILPLVDGQLSIAQYVSNPRWRDALRPPPYEQNSERDPHELRKVNLISTSANWHPAPDWWTSGRIAVKDLTETLSGVKSPYQAWLVSGRVIYDLTDRIDTGILASVMGDSQDRALQYALGAEVGYLVHKNVWISLGYNLTGFNDPDLSSSDYTRQGVFLRLRMKFDEALFKNSYKVEN